QHSQYYLTMLKAISTIFTAGILAFDCSLFFSYHGLRPYNNNRRIPINRDVEFLEPFNKNTNVFYDNYLIVILFIVKQALLSFKLYKHFYFKLFAIFMILTIGANYLPFVD